MKRALPHRRAAAPCELAGAVAGPRSMRRVLPRVSRGWPPCPPTPHPTPYPPPDGRGKGGCAARSSVAVGASGRGQLGGVCPGFICALQDSCRTRGRRSVSKLTYFMTGDAEKTQKSAVATYHPSELHEICPQIRHPAHPVHLPPTRGARSKASIEDAPNLVRRFHGRNRAAVLRSGCAASPSSFSTINATQRRRLAGRLPGFRT